MKCIDHAVRRFLEFPSKKKKVVINLGCGYDPLPWQCLGRYPALSNNVKFVDIDYRDLMLKKRDVVKNTDEYAFPSGVIRNPKSGKRSGHGEQVLFALSSHVPLILLSVLIYVSQALLSIHKC